MFKSRILLPLGSHYACMNGKCECQLKAKNKIVIYTRVRHNQRGNTAVAFARRREVEASRKFDEGSHRATRDLRVVPGTLLSVALSRAPRTTVAHLSRLYIPGLYSPTVANRSTLFRGTTKATGIRGRECGWTIVAPSEKRRAVSPGRENRSAGET